MATTQEHALNVINRLGERRARDGTIPTIRAADLIESYGYRPSHYAVAFGQAVSLLDATCLLEDLPWLGRLVVFDWTRDDLNGPWASWRPHMKAIIEAPQRKRWSDADLARIAAGLPQVGAAKWWKQREPKSAALLTRAVRAAHR